MDNLFKQITAWQRDTFGETTPLSVAKHLRKEVDEVIEALEKGDKDHVRKEELPDLQILTFNLADKLGMDFYDLSANTRLKFKKNLNRKWLKPDADGCVHHEKTEKEKSTTWEYQGKTLEEMSKEELYANLRNLLTENTPNPHFVKFKGE